MCVALDDASCSGWSELRTPPTAALQVGHIAPGSTAVTEQLLVFNPSLVVPGPAKPSLQAAIKTNELGVLYVNDQVEHYSISCRSFSCEL